MTHITRCSCCGKPSPYQLCSRECVEAYQQAVKGRDGSMYNRGAWMKKTSKLRDKEATA